MDEILTEFYEESKTLVAEMQDILEEIEDSPEQLAKLESFGQLVDRIMGSSQTMVMAYDNPLIQDIGNYAELCKIIGYKGSQIPPESELATITIAFLLDANEMLEELVDAVGSSKDLKIHDFLNEAFLSRLKLLSTKFDDSLRASVGMGTAQERAATVQAQVDDLLKKIGL